MLMPKRVKFRKQFRGSMAGTPTRGTTISYGEYGLVCCEPVWIRSNQIEAARVAMTRYIKRYGKVWIKIFPDKPVTKKPAEVRMRLPAYRKRRLRKHFVWQQTSFPASARSFPRHRWKAVQNNEEQDIFRGIEK